MPDTTKEHSELNKALDLVWDQSFSTHYETYFQEIRYEIKLKWLQAANSSTAWIVAVTATGTGIGGWVLWGTEVGKYIWGGVAAIASLVSITHAVLKIADRNEHHMEVFRKLRALRRQLESFRQSIRRQQIEPTPEKVRDAEARYKTLRDEYEEIDREVAPSGLFDAQRGRVQDALDRRMKEGGWI